MLSIEKASKILNVIYESYPSLKDEELKIKYGEEFAAEIGLFDSIVYIQEKAEESFTMKMIRYLRKEFNLLDSECMFDGFIEVHAFLHEVGHIYYKDLEETKALNREYQRYKNKAYVSYNEAFNTYRKIKGEQYADEFAMICIRKNLTKIWAIMQNQTEEEAREEIAFWGEM